MARGYLLDRKSTRLNSSHLVISYAVFCLKKFDRTLNSRAQLAPPDGFFTLAEGKLVPQHLANRTRNIVSKPEHLPSRGEVDLVEVLTSEAASDHLGNDHAPH